MSMTTPNFDSNKLPVQRKSIVSRTCVICSKEFLVHSAHHKQQACDRKCGAILRLRHGPRNLERLNKTCEVCGKEFSVPQCFKEQKTCGKECGGVARRKDKRKGECKHCGKEFSANVSDPKVFCNTQCCYEYRKGPHSTRHVTDVSIVCQTCLKEFKAKHNWERYKKFCSKECLSTWRSKDTGFPVGSLRTDPDGYVFIKTSPGTWEPEHRVVMEKKLGRKLTSDERVHHRNGNPADNRDFNLQTVTLSEHMALHYLAERIGLSSITADSWIPDPEGMAC